MFDILVVRKNLFSVLHSVDNTLFILYLIAKYKYDDSKDFEK